VKFISFSRLLNDPGLAGGTNFVTPADKKRNLMRSPRREELQVGRAPREKTN
jgi:hypothetical protein